MLTLGIIVSMVSIPFFAIAVELDSTNFDLVGFLGAIYLVCEHSSNRVFLTSATP